MAGGRSHNSIIRFGVGGFGREDMHFFQVFFFPTVYAA